MTPKEFGKYMRDCRLRAGFETMEALARASGVSAPTIMRIEDGKTETPTVATLKKLATPLKVSFEELMKAAGFLNTSSAADTIKEPCAEYLADPKKLAELDRATLVRLQAYISAVLDFANEGDLSPDDLRKIETFKKFLISQRQEVSA